jgi:hypothetical protein
VTDEELRAIKERCEKATPGPWEWSDGTCDDEDGERHGYRCGPMWVDVCDQLAVPVVDAEFIAHAREDVPALLAEVERLRRPTAE